MTKQIKIRVSELKAAVLFASDDDSRYVLNGVKIEVRKNKQPVIVSTDGRRLAVIETVAEQDEPHDADADFILASHFLKPLCQFCKKPALEIAFEYHPSERVVCYIVGGTCVVDSEKGAVIQGEYPAWRQAVPTGEKVPVGKIGVNSEYIGVFAKIAKLLECDTPCIEVNIFSETDAMEVKITERPNFYAVVMPIKPKAETVFQPEFLGLEKTKG